MRPAKCESSSRRPDGDSPEGIAIDADDGAVYVGNRSPAGGSSITSDILKINDDGKIDLHFAALPMASLPSNGLLGLAIHKGDVFAALDSDDPLTHGVYKISKRGKRIKRLAGSASLLTPNALAFDDHHNLYVTDSLGGAVWRFDSNNINQPGQLWLQDELLTPDPDNMFGLTEVGANGVAFVDGNLIVANTSRNLLARIGIGADGDPSSPEVVAGGDPIGPLTTIDGIAATADGSSILAAIPGFAVLTVLTGEPFAPVVKVDLGTGQITPVAFEDPDDPVFETPLSVALSLDGNSVFVTNGALPDDDIFGVPQPGPSVVEVGLDFDDAEHIRGRTKAVPEPATATLLVLGAAMHNCVLRFLPRWRRKVAHNTCPTSTLRENVDRCDSLSCS